MSESAKLYGIDPEDYRRFLASVRVGSVLKPLSLWNATERGGRKMPGAVVVRDIKLHQRSQTTIMVLVESVDRRPLWLDLGWFKPEVVRQQGEQKDIAG